MGKDTRKRAGKRPVRKKAVKSNGKGAVRSSISRDKKIAAGEYKIEEIEILRLQKLMHQLNSLGQQANLLAEQHRRKQEEAVATAKQFEAMVEEVKKGHGLEEYHEVKLSDEEGGLVMVNTKKKAEVEAKAKAKEAKVETN